MAAGTEIGTGYISIVPSAKGFASKLQGEIGPDLDRSGKDAGSKFSGGIMGGVKGLAGPIAAAFGAIEVGNLFGDMIGEAREAEKVGKTTEAIIRATGGAAKISAKDISELAGSISDKVGMDDEAIQSGANLLLTFKNVRNEAGAGNDVFNRATKAAVDLSAAGFGSVESASKMLGKALNDPVAGLAAMGKAGVTFSDQQKEQIKTLVESGKTLEAQKLIMKEVESQVGGTAEANASAADKMAVKWGNFKEQAGTLLLPVIDKLLGGLSGLLDWASPALDEFGTSMGNIFTLLGTGEFTGGIFGLSEDSPFIGALFKVREFIGTAQDAWAEFKTALTTGEGDGPPWLMALATALRDIGTVLVTQVWPAVQQFVTQLAAGLGPILAQVGTVIFTQILPALMNLWQVIVANVMPIYRMLADMFFTYVLPAVRSFIDFIVVNVLPIFLRLVDFVAANVIPTIANIARIIISTVVPAAFAIWNAIQTYVLPPLASIIAFLVDVVFPKLWEFVNRVVVPIFQMIGSFVTWAVQTLIVPALKAIGWFLENVLFPVIRFLWSNVVSPTIDLLIGGFEWLKTNVIDKAGEMMAKVKSGIETGLAAVKGFFENFIRGVGIIWDGLKAIVSAPVKFVIETVINNGIIKGWNDLIGLLKLPDNLRVGKIDVPGFWSGGVLPGAGMSHGDDMLVIDRHGRPQATVASGEPVISRASYAANKPIVDAILAGAKIPGFFLGGTLPTPGPVRPHRLPYYGAAWAGDMGLGMGSPIYAWKDGTVASVSRKGYSYGNETNINHAGQSTKYAHQSEILVAAGQMVRAGQLIGRIGSTGNSTGPHLHFEVRGGNVNRSDDSGGGGFNLLSAAVGWVTDKLAAPVKALLARIPGAGLFVEAARATGTRMLDGVVEKVKSLLPSFGSDPSVSAPVASGDRVSWGGHMFDRPTADMLAKAQGLLGSRFTVTQGSFSTSVRASGSTHAGAGAVDIGAPVTGAAVNALRQVGFAAWDRTGRGPWGPHIHAVANVPGASAAALAQYRDFLRGGDGLGGYWRGTDSARRGWAWVGERGPELVNFGGGEQVVPHGKSKEATSGGGPVINYNPTVVDRDPEREYQDFSWRMLRDLQAVM